MFAAVALITVATSGCASVAGLKPDPRDPFERTNRAIFRVNDALDRGVARPAAMVYHRLTPQFVQTGVSNFMSNIGYPTVIINDILQGKFRDGLSDLGRFAMNTSFGLGGLFDPATSAGLEVHDEEFGQTLGKWGVPIGPYLMLPVLGPSSIRDSFGLALDTATDPRQYLRNTKVKWGLQGLRLLDRRTQLLGTDAVLERAADKYTFIRSAYLQHREYQMKDGKEPDQSPSDLDDPDPGADKPGADKPGADHPGSDQQDAGAATKPEPPAASSPRH